MSRWGVPQPDIDFIHRSADGAEIYFLTNRKSQAEAVVATFRVSGRQPELWDPVSGQRRNLPAFESKDGSTTVPLEFEPDGSMFIVFRKRSQNPEVRMKRRISRNWNRCRKEITGPWAVQFDPQWFYPIEGLSGDQAKGLMHFDKLDDWATHAEPAVKHFSGKAVYRKAFELAGLSTIQDPQSKIYLDLGKVTVSARVKLNGQDLGVVWCNPWRVDVTGAIKSGKNELEIEIVNNWPNRLTGDGKLPEAQRRTRTNIQNII